MNGTNSHIKLMYSVLFLNLLIYCSSLGLFVRFTGVICVNVVLNDTFRRNLYIFSSYYNFLTVTWKIMISVLPGPDIDRTT